MLYSKTVVDQELSKGWNSLACGERNTSSQPDSCSEHAQNTVPSPSPELYRSRFCHLLWCDSTSKGEQEFRHCFAVKWKSKRVLHIGEILLSFLSFSSVLVLPNVFFLLLKPENRTYVHVLPQNINRIHWPSSLFSFGCPTGGRKTRWDVSQSLKPRCHGDNSGRDLCHPVLWLQWITNAFGNIFVETLCVYLSHFPVMGFPVWWKKKKNSPNPARDWCRNGVTCLYPSFYWLSVSCRSETSSLAFISISSQQPIIESHSLKRSNYILKKNFLSLFIFFQGEFSCCR